MTSHRLLLGLLLSLCLATTCLAGNTERVSVSTEGQEGNWPSTQVAISADGRFVAFESDAYNLVPGDTNYVGDVYLHDRLTDRTERISISDTGEQPGCGWPAISADARFVAFEAHGPGLVPGGVPETSEILVRDRLYGTLERVSVNNALEPGNDESYQPAITPDGRFVAFKSHATNLVPGDTNLKVDMFVRDREEPGLTERVSVNSDEVQANGDSHDVPAISADGRFVAFFSEATNLVPEDNNGTFDLFLRDRQEGVTELISVSLTGGPGNGMSIFPVISADGRFVAFCSAATDLVEGDDANAAFDIFVRDRQEGTTELISVSSAGEQGNSESSFPAISADGRFVVFISNATNLVPGVTQGVAQVFIRDRVRGVTQLLSVSNTGEPAAWDCAFPDISADGRSVAFASVAWNLVPDDANGYSDIFIHDRGFRDIPKWHWAWRETEGLRDAGITEGYWDQTYRPQIQVDRAQMAVYISRVMELPTAPCEGRFSDVPPGYWACPDIEALAREGIVQGFTPTEYRPTVIVNRDAMAVYIRRSLDLPTAPCEGRFPDVPPGHWACPDIEAVAREDIVQGYPGGLYHPGWPVDRAQMAVYICRAWDLPIPTQTYDIQHYLRLQDGDTWTYSCDDGPNTESVVGDVDVGGQSCKVVQDSYGSTNHWLLAEDRAAWAGGSFGHPPTDTITFLPFFAFPNGVQPGDAATASASCYLGTGYVGELRYSVRFLGIEGVSVPAGSFPDCMKWEVEWLYPTGAGGEHAHFFVWYARGVGRVKVDSRPFGGEGWCELVDATIGDVRYPPNGWDVTDYWPLTEGDAWIYQDEGSGHTRTISGTIDIWGDLYARVYDSRGSYEYWRAAADGLRFGGLVPSGLGSVTLSPPFHFPNGAYPGEGDTQYATIYVDGVSQGVQAVCTYAFLTVEDVTVPAGLFGDCLKIEMHIDYAGQHQENFHMWVAEGVGPVKRDERPFGGTEWEELTAATVGGVTYPACQPDVSLDGWVEPGIEFCWVLRTEGWESFELLGPLDFGDYAGQWVTVEGRIIPDIASFCMVGPLLLVCSIHPS